MNALLTIFLILFISTQSDVTHAARSAQSTSSSRIRAQEKFSKKICPICLTHKKKSHLYTLNCSHDCCLRCLKNMLKISIEEKSTMLMRCPDENCRSRIKRNDIKTFSDNHDDYTLFKKIKKRERIAKNPDAIFCPTPDCAEIFLKEAHQQYISCSACTITYCSHCQLQHTDIVSCKEARISKKKADKKSDQWKKIYTKPCPQCTMPIEKDGGCKHMVCSQCKYNFCWNCLKQYSNSFISMARHAAC
jgi:hypothetical protein